MNSAWTSYLFLSGLGFLSIVYGCPLGIEIESWSEPLSGGPAQLGAVTATSPTGVPTGASGCRGVQFATQACRMHAPNG
jgi:hypothetical protein